MKRWISFLLVLILLLQFPIGTMAAEAKRPTFKVETVTAAPGESSVKVKILVENNPGIASAKLTINYDDTILDLTNVEYNTQWGGMYQLPQYYRSPLTLNWFNGTADFTQQNAVYATLTFDIVNNAKVGTSAINLSYDPEDVYNILENNVAFETVNGGIVIQESTPETPTEPPVEPPTEPIPGDSPVFRVETKEAAPGDTSVIVNIWVENNPGIASVKLMVDYDDDLLSLDNVEYNTQWGGMHQMPQTLNNPVTLNWFNGVGNYTTADSVFATLSFSVLQSAQEGLANIKVSYDPEDVYNIAEVNQEFAVANGGIKVTTQATTQGKKGDLDADGLVDMMDFVILAQHIGEVKYITNPIALTNADVTRDGVIDMRDFVKLAQFIGEVISEL